MEDVVFAVLCLSHKTRVNVRIASNVCQHMIGFQTFLLGLRQRRATVQEKHKGVRLVLWSSRVSMTLNTSEAKCSA
jgi:hypothetical protein